MMTLTAPSDEMIPSSRGLVFASLRRLFVSHGNQTELLETASEVNEEVVEAEEIEEARTGQSKSLRLVARLTSPVNMLSRGFATTEASYRALLCRTL